MKGAVQRRREPTVNGQKLVVWGERRDSPDWDAYIAALLSYAMREVGAEVDPVDVEMAKTEQDYLTDK